MATSNIVCILSPPRSGSSLTASVLNVLGVYLGEPEGLAEGNVHNPRGYWEHKAILTINNEILSRLDYDYPSSRGGADWKSPPVFPIGWEKDQQLSDLKEYARKIIRKDFEKHELWGWKDPRTCFTLPFWQEILPSMQYIVCIRNPVDVAHSQQRFINCSFERGLYLWMLYLKYAFQHTGGQNRILIQTESWTGDWGNELARLSQFIGRPVLRYNKAVLKAVRNLIDGNLWHYNTQLKGLSTVLELYNNIFNVQQLNDEGWKHSFEITLEQLASEAKQSDGAKKQKDKFHWQEQLNVARRELTSLIPEESHLVLVDDNQIGTEFITGRTVIPFLECNGHYWGHPSEDSEAIKELLRLRKIGASYLVFIWPSYWWLEYYSIFNDYLRSTFRCVFQNERLIIFDLRP